MVVLVFMCCPSSPVVLLFCLHCACGSSLLICSLALCFSVFCFVFLLCCPSALFSISSLFDSLLRCPSLLPLSFLCRPSALLSISLLAPSFLSTRPVLYPARAGLHDQPSTPEQTNRERDFAAQWQGDAETLQNLNPSDRDALAKNLRQALGKTTKLKKKKSSSKKNRKTSSPVTNEGPPGGAFDSSSVAGGGKGFGSSGAGGSGARGSAAAAAAAAGGQQEKGKNKGALGDAAATPAPEKTGQRVVSLAGGEGSAEGTRFSDGVAAVLGRKESVTVPASVDAGREGTPDISGTYDEDASGGGGVEVGDENASSQGEEHEAGVGEEAAATRVMAFGRGVAVVPDGDRGSGPEKNSRDHHARTFGGGVATAVPASSPVDASSPVSASSSVDAPPLADVSSPESEENKGITGGGTGGGRIPSFGGGVAIPGKDE